MIALEVPRSGPVGPTTAGQIISRSGILEATTDFLNRHLVVPRAVHIISKRCGMTNAYYSPTESRIVLCDELLHWMSGLFPAKQMTSASYRDAILGATVFFVYHEVGHALVDLYDVPELGRSAGEDMADALATFLLASQGASNIALVGADAFRLMARSRRPNEGLAFWDEHSLDEQRFYNIMCYLFGSDPGRYAFLVGNGILPVARARTCPADYETIKRGAARILGPHLRQ